MFCLQLSMLLVGVAHAMPGEEFFQGEVVKIIDGNTIEVLADDNEYYQIMFHEIDCPELTQAFGAEAKAFTEKMLLNKKVTVKLITKDRWGNRLAVVFKDTDTDVRLALLQAGLAWTSERNPNEAFEALRMESINAGRGLWAEDQPTPPWIYRRQQTMLQVKSS